MANPIDDNDDLAKALGRLAGRWGLAEFTVDMIFTLLSEMPERKATITFSFFRSTGTQKDVIHFMADETTWLPDDTKERVKAAVKKYADMAGTRNGFIHYPFGYDRQSENEFQIYKGKRSRTGDNLLQKKNVSPKMITEFCEEINTLYDELMECHREILDVRFQALRTQPPYPGLSALFSIPRNGPKPRAKRKRPSQ